jgi:cation transport ATPase
MVQRGLLAHELNAVESLASVDVVFTDKTRTLTEPTGASVRDHPANDPLDQRLAALDAQLGVTVQLHPVSSWDCVAWQLSA